MNHSKKAEIKDSLVRRILAPHAASIRLRPEFRTAVADYCIQLLNGQLRVPLRKIINQEFRYEICFRAIANHTVWRQLGGDPPTLSLLKTQSRASARQVADFVACLRQVGLLKAVKGLPDGRTLILEPDPRLIDEVGLHPRLTAEIYMRFLESRPGGSFPSDWIVELILLGAQISDGLGLSESPYQIVAEFAAHESGFHILAAVLQSYYASLLNEKPVCDLTYASLANRFHVSQSHVANLIRKARSKGWFNLTRGGRLLEIKSSVVDDFEGFIAIQAVLFGRIAADIRGRIPHAAAGAGESAVG